MVKEFTFFLKKYFVKRQHPDKNLAYATYAECIDRLQFAKHVLKNEKIKYALENAYEAMREAADTLLYFDGFKSYSHEASIAYLLEKGFSEHDLQELDRFRKIRNDIKYYGGDCDEDDAKTAIKLAEKIIPKIKEWIK